LTDGPVITTHPLDSTVKLGDTATFTCIATGKPAPLLQWYARNQIVGEGGTLTITDAKSENSASYTCIASNQAGTASSNPARLVIFGMFYDNFICLKYIIKNMKMSL